MSVCTWHDPPKGCNFWNGFCCLWMPGLWHACSELQWRALTSVLVNFMQTCEPLALLRDRPSSLKLGLHRWQYPKEGVGIHGNVIKVYNKSLSRHVRTMLQKSLNAQVLPWHGVSVTECWSSAHTKGIWTSKDYLFFRENLFLPLFL